MSYNSKTPKQTSQSNWALVQENCDQVRLTPICLASETSSKVRNLDVRGEKFPEFSILRLALHSLNKLNSADYNSFSDLFSV